MKNNLKNRQGKMYISEELLLEPSNNFNEAMFKLGIRIVRCEFIYDKRAFEYYFYSPFAKELIEGGIIEVKGARGYE
jgi:hypothetical protein